MVADIKSLIQKTIEAHAKASEADKVAYAAYVEDCHSEPGVFVSEFNFKE